MRSPLLLLAAILLFAAAPLVAVDKTWDAGGGAGAPDWTTADNWDGTAPGVAPTANDALIFPILNPSSLNKTAINDFVAGTAFGPITIDANGYVLSGSQINLNGGLFLNGANSAQVALPLELAIPLAFTVSNSSGILTLTQPINGSGGIIKSGNGLLILNNTHTYTGPTIINGGTLQVGGSLPGVIQLNSGYIAGTGSVDGITSLNQGITGIVPGTSSATGTLTCDGDVALFANDTVWFDITSTGSDKLAVNGAVDLQIGLDGFFLSLQSGYTPAVNTSFILIENDGSDPVVFDTVTPSNYLTQTFLLNNQRFQISFVGGTNRNDVVLTKVAVSNTSVSSFTSNNPTTNFGDLVTFTASFTGTVNGATVSFFDGNQYLGSDTIASSQAQFSTTTLMPGERQITALFEGNDTYAPLRSSILEQDVAGAPTNIVLGVTPTPSSTPDQLVTLTATVNTVPVGGSPSGTVTFFDGVAALATIAVATNQAVHSTATLFAGDHSLSATYNPTGGFVGSESSAVAHEVTGTATTTTLISSLNPAVAGSEVTLTATVGGGTPTGSVVFRDGAVTLGTIALSGSDAVLTISGLSAGTHSIMASYLGSTEEEPSVSTALSQVITAAPDGSGSSGGTGNDVELSGGCGLGSGTAALLFGLLMVLGLRLRRI